MDDAKTPPGTSQRIEVTAELDPHAAELLRLEIGRLARRHGVEIKAFRIEKLADEGEEAAGE